MMMTEMLIIMVFFQRNRFGGVTCGITVSKDDVSHTFFDGNTYANAVEARHHGAVYALHHLNWSKVCPSVALIFLPSSS